MPVGAWVLVAERAVQHGAKTTLTACGRRHPGAVRPRRLMTKMLLMPTRQRRHPVLRVVLMRADDPLRHFEHGSRRLTMHDHRGYAARLSRSRAGRAQAWPWQLSWRLSL